MKDGIQIIGDKELAANLRALPDKLKKKVVRKAMKAGAAVVAKEAKREVPVESGLLRKAIKSQGTRSCNGRIYVDPKIAEVYDGKLRRPSKYAHLVEFGTRHSKAQPFMRSALENKKGAAFDAVANKARQEFAKL